MILKQGVSAGGISGTPISLDGAIAAVRWFVGEIVWRSCNFETSVFFVIILLILLFAYGFCHIFDFHNDLEEQNLTLLFLLVWFGGTVLSSMMRLNIIKLMAPRYLFYPYICFTWLILAILNKTLKKQNAKKGLNVHLPAAIFLLCCPLTFLFDGSLSSMTRNQFQAAKWQEQIGYMLRTDNDAILHVYTGGFNDSYWSVFIRKKQCKKLIKNSLMFNDIDACIYNSRQKHATLSAILKTKKHNTNHIKFIIDQINETSLFINQQIARINMLTAQQLKTFRTSSNKSLTLSGWAYDIEHNTSASDIWVEINGILFETTLHDRLDVSRYFDNNYIIHSGFSTNIPLEYVRQGKNSCALIIFDADGESYYREEFSFTTNTAVTKKKDGNIGVYRLVSKNPVDLPCEIAQQKNDITWTQAGAFDKPCGPFGTFDYWGSWSGSDTFIGRFSLQVKITQEQRHIIIPYLTGPQSKNQSISVIDEAEENVICSIDPLPTSSSNWSFLSIEIPPGITQVVIEADDAGTGWGEWSAIGKPCIQK